MAFLLAIDAIKSIKTQDNVEVYSVTGTSHSALNIGVQPSSIHIISDTNQFKVGDIIDVSNDKINPFYMFENQDNDGWEIYGSDHNSGILWFGKNTNIKQLEEDLKHTITQNVMLENSSKVISDGDGLNTMPLMRWDFNDDYSLMIYYRDYDYGPDIDLSGIKKENVISYCFGGMTDDIMAQEIILPLAAKLLKKVKIADMEIDDDYVEDLGDYTEGISVNGKKIKKEHNSLVIRLAYHLFCSLMNWQNDEESETACLAKKLEKFVMVEAISLPLLNTTHKLTWIDDSYNKEYNLALVEENGQYIVQSEYGGIGKKMTKDIVYSGPDLNQSQKSYINTLKEKLYKGYSLDSTLIHKKKLHI